MKWTVSDRCDRHHINWCEKTDEGTQGLLCCALCSQVSWFITVPLLCSTAKHFWATWSSRNNLLQLCFIFGGAKQTVRLLLVERGTQTCCWLIQACWKPGQGQSKAWMKAVLLARAHMVGVWNIELGRLVLTKTRAQQTWAHCLAMIYKTLSFYQTVRSSVFWMSTELWGCQQLPRQATKTFENTEIKLCSSRITTFKKARVKVCSILTTLCEHQHLCN